MSESKLKAKAFHIEISGICSFKCRTCQYPFRDKELLQYMTEEVFKSSIDQMREDFLGNLLAPQILGEATLHPKFKEFMEYAVSKGCKISLFTNSTRLNEDMSKFLLSMKGIERICLETYGNNKKDFELESGRDYYDIVTPNIKRFLKLASKKKYIHLNSPDITVKRNRYPTSGDKAIEKFYAEWEPYVKRINTARSVYLDKYKEAWLEDWDLHNMGGFFTINSEILDGVKWKKGSFMSGYNSEKSSGLCSFLFDGPSIFANGDVSFCCLNMDKKSVFGNIKSKSLKDLWLSRFAMKLRWRVANGRYDKVEPCDKCTLHNNQNIYPVEYLKGKSFRELKAMSKKEAASILSLAARSRK